MTQEPINIPARHITAGDHAWGFVISTTRNLPDGSREFTFVVPFQTTSMKGTVEARFLDTLSFPVTKRGDDYSPNRRNALLGLPPVEPKPYVAPEPIAIYPAGTRISDVEHFDRSMKVQFHCPDHPQNKFASKDPYVSHWFPATYDGTWCPEDCVAQVGDHVVSEDYKPTRDG